MVARRRNHVLLFRSCWFRTLQRLLPCFLIVATCHAVSNGAIYTVTSHADSGAGSLREAVDKAISGDRIEFAVTGTINLIDRLELPDDVAIVGPGARKLRLLSAGGTPLLDPLPGSRTVSGLTLEGGGPNVAVNGSCELVLVDCAIVGAVPSGVQLAADSKLSMTGCTVSGNKGRYYGGGIVGYGDLTMTNCTVAGNTVIGFKSKTAEGGGICAFSPATISMTNCTIAGNSAVSGSGFGEGGGIYQENGASVQIANSIIEGNSTDSGHTPDVAGEFFTRGHNFIGKKDGSTGFNNGLQGDIVGTKAAPRVAGLGALRDNGGPTRTMLLAPGSLAVNSANTISAPERDQRGYVRANAPDIGAYEAAATVSHSLANISTRLAIQSGDNVLIGGFIVTGSDPKKLLLRALGPSLNVAGRLADPTLELYDSSNKLVAANNDWGTAPNKQAIINTNAAPSKEAESAILLSLKPGAYTAIVRGAGGATGVGSVEAYDLDRTGNALLANISTRGLVQTDEKVMIGGFIVLGPDSQNVIVRALGPSLPVNGTLANPKLQLFDGNGGLITENDDWRSNDEQAIAATGVPPPNDLEAAIVTTLPPASYTAIVTGAQGGTGVGAVEVYALD